MTEEKDQHLDREKWLAESAFRERELRLKERESERARWSNPLAIAVFAAAVAGAGNVVVATLNSDAQRKIEVLRASEQQTIEQMKEEESHIMDVIRGGNPAAAATNLRFLLDAGLIKTPERVAAIKDFLANRSPPKDGSPSPDDIKAACNRYPAMC